MSNNLNLKKAEVVITIDPSKILSISNVDLINFPFVVVDQKSNPNPKSNLSIAYSTDDKIYKISDDNNSKGINKFSQIIIKNLDPMFNPLQITLIGKNYDPNFSTNSINFVDVFSSGSGSKMYIDKKQNTLTLTNFISMMTSDTNVTSEFKKNNDKSHLIGKIIILYEME